MSLERSSFGSFEPSSPRPESHEAKSGLSELALHLAKQESVVADEEAAGPAGFKQTVGELAQTIGALSRSKDERLQTKGQAWTEYYTKRLKPDYQRMQANRENFLESSGGHSRAITRFLTYAINEATIFEPPAGWEIKFTSTDKLTDIQDGIDARLILFNKNTAEELVIGLDVTAAPADSDLYQQKVDRIQSDLFGRTEPKTHGHFRRNHIYRSPFTKQFALGADTPLIVLGYSPDTLEQMGSYWQAESQHQKAEHPDTPASTIDREIFISMHSGTELVASITNQLDQWRAAVANSPLHNRHKLASRLQHLQDTVERVMVPITNKNAATETAAAITTPLKIAEA